MIEKKSNHRSPVYSTITLIVFSFMFLNGCGGMNKSLEKEYFLDASSYAINEIKIAQHEEGYWTTKFTSGTSYDSLTEEINTFLPAVMVDLLEPIVHDVQLDEVLKKGREFMLLQIEETGLVRYYGNPNSKLPFWSCMNIAPDSDDTSLAWLISSPGQDDARFPMVLESLSAYQAENGLYQTWLTPSVYGIPCIDPGAVPNPTDVGIQMHLILFFSQYSPERVSSLCKSLNAAIGEDANWVYYKVSPLLPILRLPQLLEAGCKIDFPDSRVKEAAIGQEIWISAAQLLNEESPAKDDVNRILKEVSEDNFKIMKINPPLIYHNDVTAHLPRYYWSPEMGYAIWLKLYAKAVRLDLVQ